MRARRDPGEADRLDRETGYPDQTRGVRVVAYVTDAKKYWIATDGLDALPKGLAEQAGNGGELMLKTRVLDVTRAKASYTLRLSRRDGLKLLRSRLQARAVVICVPPRSAGVDRRPAVPQRTTPCSRPALPCLRHRRRGASAARSPPPGSGSHRSTATRGTRRSTARSRRRLLVPDAPVAPGRVCPAARADAGADPGHYWQLAFHMWRPVHGFGLQHAVEASVEPTRRNCPGIPGQRVALVAGPGSTSEMAQWWWRGWRAGTPAHGAAAARVGARTDG